MYQITLSCTQKQIKMIIQTSKFWTFKGKLKDLVIYQCNGQTYARRKPDKEKFVIPEGVKKQQERIAGVAALYQAAKKAQLHEFWQQAAKGSGQTGYNLFVKCNIKGFTGEGKVSDFRKIALTIGNLQLPDDLHLTRAGEQEWRLTWNNDTPYPECSPDDQVRAVVMRDKERFSVIVPEFECARRGECETRIRLPPELQEYRHLFVYFCSADGTRTSWSRYFEIA